VRNVIKGWEEVLKIMPVGSKFKVYIPQELGYGNQEQTIIKPYSTLVFEIKLLDIE
jgi:FKBP-type peptidyl-prolyl cis-trans isomerase FklB